MRQEKFEFSSKVGKKVKWERTKRGLSQEKLAELSGISPNYVGDIERGSSSPTLEVVYRISQALGMSIVDLINIHKISL